MATQVLAEPVSTFYKVDFSSSGDTTNQAFGKHIQEIERIYGYLKALDLGKVSASDVSGLSGSIGNLTAELTKHINDTNPHPNYKPSVSWSDLTGTKPNLADLNGNLPMSRITGNLPTSRIDGLQSFVEGLIPSDSGSGSTGDGITESNIAKNGYAKFNNGLIIQWGVTQTYDVNGGKTETYSENFATSFSEACYVLLHDGPTYRGDNMSSTISSYSKQSYIVYISNTGTFAGKSTEVKYIAIGK